MAVHLGLNCVLKRGTAGTTTVGSLTTMGNVRDVTLNIETGEADVTTRASNGWRQYLATLKEASLEFGMLVNYADQDFKAVRTACLNNGKLAFAVLDDSGNGLIFDGMVTGLGNDQPLEEGDSVNVTIRPSSVPTDVQGSGSVSGSGSGTP